VTVAEVADQDPDVLSYLSDHGVQPGVELEILEIAPFGMVTARSSDADEPVSLPRVRRPSRSRCDARSPPTPSS